MGLLGSLEWLNAYGKKHCKSLFWRVRAAVKKALKDGAKQKQQLRFQYDPSSYALNFDDGCCHIGDGAKKVFGDGAKKIFGDGGVQELAVAEVNNTTWVYVIWVKTK